MKIFNAKSQQIEDAEMSVDDNNEIVATFKDGGIVKFPAGLSQADFDKLVQAHEDANKGQEVITEEMEQARIDARNASLKIIGNPIPEDQFNGTDEDPTE